MAARQGRLSLLAVVAVFAVVLGSMQFGLAYSRGEILRQDPLTGAEEQLRADLRERVDAERAAAGLEPARRGEGPRGAAQETARALVGTDYFDAPTAAGLRPDGTALPNRKGLCYRVPAKLTVTHPGWNGGESPSRASSRAVATRLTGLLASAEVGVLHRPNDHRHGVGVAVDGDVVYAVYRACNLGY
jgi:hypothetical protein